jgi:hypothetical protein
LVRATTLASGAVALTADAHPAGAPLPDAVLVFGFAALIPYASSYARRWTWPVIAGFAAVLAEGTAQLIVATGTVGLAVVALFLPQRSRPLGALVAASAVQLLLRQPTDGALYLPTLLSAVAITPTIFSAYENGPRRVRTRFHLAIVVGAVVGVIGVGALGVGAFQARADVREAISLANDGLDAAQDSNSGEAARMLNESARLFDQANDRLTAPWMLPARVLPVIGNNANALVVATEQGRELARTAARTAAVVDLDDLSFADGQIDLGAIEAIDTPIEDAARAAEGALTATVAADSPWLIAPIDSRMTELLDELSDTTPTLRNAADLVHIAPDLLGQQGERRYLVLFFTPSELRGLGGFIGGFAELLADDGRLELVRTGRPVELNNVLRSASPRLDGPDDYLDMWGQYSPELYFQDISFSPDFPDVASVATQLYAQAGGAVVDGVIALDPEALAALTEFTGPIELNGERYGPRQLGDYLLNGQYLAFEDDNADRLDALDVALDEVFTGLLSIDTPSPRKAANTLGPVVDAGRLMMTTADDAENEALRALGLTGDFPAAAGDDLLSVVAQNNANNKIDYYLERVVDYDAVVQSNGRIDAKVTIDITNTAPAGGGNLPSAIVGSNDRGLEQGLNRTAVTVYTPHRLEGATIDGEPIGARQGSENDVAGYSFTVDVSAAETRRLELTLLGGIESPDDYRLLVAPQPTVRPDLYRLRIDLPGEARIEEERRGTTDFVVGRQP